MKFKITISRTATASKTFEVEADSMEAAKSIALDEAYNTDFTGMTSGAEYDVQDTQEIEDPWESGALGRSMEHARVAPNEGL